MSKESNQGPRAELHPLGHVQQERRHDLNLNFPEWLTLSPRPCLMSLRVGEVQKEETWYENSSKEARWGE